MIRIALLILSASGARAEMPPITTWDWQLSQVDTNTQVDLLDLDPDAVTADQVAAIKARGIYTVCYVSVGTWEDWRSDKAAFPADVIGAPYEEWPGESFLDLRRHDILIPLMERRFRRCKQLGFQAIEPDVIDSYQEQTGFALGASDAVAYVIALADMAHAMGLAIGQKNAPELVPKLEPHLDFALFEECAELGFCADAAPYVQAGKPVLNAEYNIPPADRPGVCAQSRDLGILTIFKSYDLGTTGSACD